MLACVVVNILPDMATKTEERTAADKLAAARNKNLDLAIQQIAKDYGEGAIMRLGGERIVDIDVEHALDPGYAKRLGVNLDDYSCRSPAPVRRLCEYARRWCAPMPWTLS